MQQGSALTIKITREAPNKLSLSTFKIVLKLYLEMKTKDSDGKGRENF